MYNQYNDKINFITIYIREAHACDEWPIRTKEQLCIKQAKNISQRIEMANKLVEQFDYKLPLLIDNMENEFMNKFSAWPLRAFMINGQNSKISWILKPKQPGYYDAEDIAKHIDSLFKL